MSGRDTITDGPGEVLAADDGEQYLRALIANPSARSAAIPNIPGIVVGELVAIMDDGCTPLITYGGQPGSAALRARSVIDLHGTHIGKSLVLMFENGDANRPLIMGLLRGGMENALPVQSDSVEVSVDDQRMIVTAREQLVLRCGKASITLTKAGKVLIEGSYVLSRSTGVNRVKGGSVQLN